MVTQCAVNRTRPPRLSEYAEFSYLGEWGGGVHTVVKLKYVHKYTWMPHGYARGIEDRNMEGGGVRRAYPVPVVVVHGGLVAADQVVVPVRRSVRRMASAACGVACG